MRGHDQMNEGPDGYDESDYCETFALAGLERESSIHASESGPDGLDAVLHALRADFLDGADELPGLVEKDGLPGWLTVGARNNAQIRQKDGAESVETFLAANTIVCAGLSARITRSQCRFNALSGTALCCASCPEAVSSGEAGDPVSSRSKRFKGDHDVDFHS